MVVSCTRWLSIRLDLLSSLFVTIVAVATMLITNSPGELMQANSVGHAIPDVITHQCSLALYFLAFLFDR